MELWAFFQAVIMGLVEGLTEFLPISSTGHLIIVGDLIGFEDKGETFKIAVQLGAILAVLFEYRQRFFNVAVGVVSDRQAQKFVLNLLIAFLPAAIMGLLFLKKIEAYLFNPISVATMLVIGGVLILWAERRVHTVRVKDVDDMTPLDAIKVGLAQMLALVPGTSRSGATIIGGLFIGLDRKVAAEFSFFLAVPTMVAATGYKLYKAREFLNLDDLALFAVGFVMAFFAGLLAVRTLVRYVSNHSFEIFGWYRIVFGGLILASWYFGWVSWDVPA
ncbi:MAG TPA: undecaprenyl-diphosphatase [Rheinheimera sp.]|nr:undecaprenyl-diphosphatase [Rheinheimera sp.]